MKTLQETISNFTLICEIPFKNLQVSSHNKTKMRHVLKFKHCCEK